MHQIHDQTGISEAPINHAFYSTRTCPFHFSLHFSPLARLSTTSAWHCVQDDMQTNHTPSRHHSLPGFFFSFLFFFLSFFFFLHNFGTNDQHLAALVWHYSSQQDFPASEPAEFSQAIPTCTHCGPMT